FLYRVTLGREWIVEKVACPKAPKRLPVVLSQDEMARFLDALRNPKHRAVLMTAYAGGVRLSQVAPPRVEGIDSAAMGIHLRPGQGPQDPRRDALPAPLGGPPRILGALPPQAVPLPRTPARPAGQPTYRPDGLPACPGGLGPEQARAYAHLAAQLRHSPARVPHRPPHDPGPARPPQPQHHRPLPP